jgi:hypothetical protein
LGCLVKIGYLGCLGCLGKLGYMGYIGGLGKLGCLGWENPGEALWTEVATRYNKDVIMLGQIALVVTFQVILTVLCWHELTT